MQKQPPRPAPAPVPVSEYQPVTGTSAQSFLTEVFGILGMEVDVNAFAHEELLRLELKGDSMGLLIGRRGETLDALQYLTNLVVNRGDEDYTKVTIDIENYRAKREEALVALAGKVAGKVLKNKKSITLEPMNPYERRIIHSTLQNVEGVTTASVGSEPSRRVVVSPEGQAPKPYRGRHNHHKKKPQAQEPSQKIVQ
ncbi:hypothetical protein SDC9_158926 [bioreactor metagenome]|uniref:R3H domain-containing protein n=1 Tax=bioreactor metagenome TaxID=1076179 RepID=A0A645FDT5_9ZZZZ